MLVKRVRKLEKEKRKRKTRKKIIFFSSLDDVATAKGKGKAIFRNTCLRM